jgi:hypothetical protein
MLRNRIVCDRGIFAKLNFPSDRVPCKISLNGRPLPIFKKSPKNVKNVQKNLTDVRGRCKISSKLSRIRRINYA